MKSFNIHIPKYNWIARVYIGMTPEYAYEVLDVLKELDCYGDNFSRAKQNLTNGKTDTGLTFSNKEDMMSVVVIGYTTSAKEFLDSLVHEIMHLSVHIADTYGIDPTSEELCYIGGDIARSFYPYCKEYLCCKCNH